MPTKALPAASKRPYHPALVVLHWLLAVMILFSSVESDMGWQVRAVIEDFGTGGTTNLELRRSEQNQPETHASTAIS